MWFLILKYIVNGLYKVKYKNVRICIGGFIFMYNSLNIDIVYDIIVYYDVFDIWFFIFVCCCDFVILYLGYIF